jgi:hypothetical protein
MPPSVSSPEFVLEVVDQARCRSLVGRCSEPTFDVFASWVAFETELSREPEEHSSLRVAHARLHGTPLVLLSGCLWFEGKLSDGLAASVTND